MSINSPEPSDAELEAATKASTEYLWRNINKMKFWILGLAMIPTIYTVITHKWVPFIAPNLIVGCIIGGLGITARVAILRQFVEGMRHENYQYRLHEVWWLMGYITIITYWFLGYFYAMAFMPPVDGNP